MTPQEIANKIIDVIKTDIIEQKKKHPNHVSYSTNVWIDGENCKNETIRFYKNRWDKCIAEGVSRYNAKQVATAVIAGLNALKAKRGWSRLMWDVEDTCSYGDGYYCRETIKFPTNIVLLADPCKEFKSLVNYLAKYCGKKLNETDIYSVHIGGKRGRVYGEEGDRHYLCHKPTTCAKYLDTLRKSRGTNDKVVCSKIKEEDDIDPWELQVSIRNEVEFDGVRLKYFEVEITTPSGRKKANIRIG